MTIRISHTDKIASGLVFLLAAAVFFVSEDFPGGYGATGPALFPRVIVGLMAGFALVQVARRVKRGDPKTHEVSLSAVKTVAVVAAMVVGYILLMPYLGFLVGTVAFLVVAMYYSGISELRRTVPISFGVTLALFYLFGEFLHVPLPESAILPVSRLLPSMLSVGVVG
ncbi:tripartite tricarboxylate transporter TctB family protein [Halobacterium yunchengense]|uniref:tripartite tricarboxylate transporter TctB family protein n=1 Tax=Halobacterium yunchengense TaxID=3108497 RepID=UPI00300804C8